MLSCGNPVLKNMLFVGNIIFGKICVAVVFWQGDVIEQHLVGLANLGSLCGACHASTSYTRNRMDSLDPYGPTWVWYWEHLHSAVADPPHAIDDAPHVGRVGREQTRCLVINPKGFWDRILLYSHDTAEQNHWKRKNVILFGSIWQSATTKMCGRTIRTY